MNTIEKNESDYGLTDPKINIGVRGRPGLKQELLGQASSMGISLSELTESILENWKSEGNEVNSLQQTVEDQKLKLKLLGEQIRDLDKVRTENMELIKKLEQENKDVSIFKNARLLWLFRNLSGLRDKVTNAYGDDFDIVYHSPKEVLLALIYSSKLNK